MQREKRARLEQAGWKVGSVQEFLGLSDEESTLIEMKLALARSLKQLRVARQWTQTALARHLKSSQSRVAKMESADASVSLDLLVRALLALGASRQDVGRAIAKGTRIPAA